MPLSPAQNAHFSATRWSVVIAARQRKTPEGQAAMVWLCERYWRPLYSWARAKGLAPVDAEDLVQGFFEQAMEGSLVGRAEASRGRFRTYLLAALGYYWTNQRRRECAIKRGGGATLMTLPGMGSDEDWVGEVAGGRTPEQEYDRAWACAVLDRVMNRLEKECDEDGHTGRFAILRVFLDGDRGEVPLAEAAQELGISLAALKSLVYRLRKRMREMIRGEIRETVETDAEVDGELQELFRALKG